MVIIVDFCDCSFAFGTKKLRNIGSDLGGAIKNFKKSVNDDDKANKE